MKVNNDIYYVGVNDYDIDLFEGQYRVPHGMSYNSYVIIDEKIAVVDTVDIHFTDEWLNNVKEVLGDRQPDYLIVQHMEPDHSANIQNFMNIYPNTTIVGNVKTFKMIDQFFELDEKIERLTVKNDEELNLGKHTLKFIFAPMVHWPEVMFTYDETDKVLFTADAFGKFGANDVKEEWVDEARRYYIGIVGKYGLQVQQVLKKASALDIQIICPLHGPVLDSDIAQYINLYQTWSSYEPQKEGVVIAYTSVYGNTKEAVELLASSLREKGTDVCIYDLARDDMSKAVDSAFCYDRLVLASTTYNGDVFPYMKEYIHHLLERNFQKRTVAFIQNGSWAPTATKVMKDMLSGCKELTLAENNVTILSAVKSNTKEELELLAEELK